MALPTNSIPIITKVGRAPLETAPLATALRAASRTLPRGERVWQRAHLMIFTLSDKGNGGHAALCPPYNPPIRPRCGMTDSAETALVGKALEQPCDQALHTGCESF